MKIRLEPGVDKLGGWGKGGGLMGLIMCIRSVRMMGFRDYGFEGSTGFRLQSLQGFGGLWAGLGLRV